MSAGRRRRELRPADLFRPPASGRDVTPEEILGLARVAADLSAECGVSIDEAARAVRILADAAAAVPFEEMLRASGRKLPGERGYLWYRFKTIIRGTR